MRLQSLPVGGEPRPSLPWTLVAASALLLIITLYLFFGAYLPAKQRLARLDAELKQLYAREAQLQTQLAQQEKADAMRAQQLTALTAERDRLVRRIEQLERRPSRSRRR
jgi:type II secretory pathway component PulM